MHYFTLLFLFAISVSTSAQVSQLSDEFEDPSTLSEWLDISEVEGWNAQHLEEHNIDTEVEGHLFLMPHTSSWFQNLRSTLLHKMVTGDFVLTTEVRATNRANNDIPGGHYSLAGLMIRRPVDYGNDPISNWTQGNENYIFHALGFAHLNHPSCRGCEGPHFEIKTTIDSDSDLQVSTAPSNHVQIRMARIGNAVVLLYAPIVDGEVGDFVFRNRYCRADFDEEMQVGFVTYTDWEKVSTYNNSFDNRKYHNSHVLTEALTDDPNETSDIPFAPDLRAEFAFARFEEVNIPMEFENSNFCDESQISNQQLLEMLNYASIPASGLSIEGLAFSAKQVDKNIILNWSNKEAKIKNHIVEHRTQNTDFQQINTIPSNHSGQYTFTHTHPQNGINYYRIGQINSDGKLQYSKVISLNYASIKEINLYPNPTTDKLILEVDKNWLEGQIELLDINGKQIIKYHIQKAKNDLNLTTLANGIYYLRIISPDGTTSMKKFVKMSL